MQIKIYELKFPKKISSSPRAHAYVWSECLKQKFNIILNVRWKFKCMNII